jgi:hypothetical protein
MANHPLPAYGALVMSVIGLGIAALGAVLASNYRNSATRHATKTIDLMASAHERLRRMPPWRRQSDRTREQAIDRQVTVDRIIGTVFFAFGVLMTVLGVALFIARIT